MFKQLKKAIKKIEVLNKPEVCAYITSLMKNAYIVGCITAENDEPELSLLMSHFISDMQNWLRLSGYNDSPLDFNQNTAYPEYIKKYELPKTLEEMDQYTEKYFINKKPLIPSKTKNLDTNLLEII